MTSEPSAPKHSTSSPSIRQSDETQSARFIEVARELGCDESAGAFEAAVKRVARHKPLEERPAEKALKVEVLSQKQQRHPL